MKVFVPQLAPICSLNVTCLFQITMSHFEFMIPIQRDDLLEGGGSGGYTVRHVYEPGDLRSSVHGKADVLYNVSYMTHFITGLIC